MGMSFCRCLTLTLAVGACGLVARAVVDQAMGRASAGQSAAAAGAPKTNEDVSRACLKHSFMARHTRDLDQFVHLNVWARKAVRENCRECCTKNQLKYFYWTRGNGMQYCLCTNNMARALFGASLNWA